MVVVNDTAVRADRNVDAGLLEILVTSGCNLDQSGSLTAADALLLTGDADRAAADADLDEVRAGLSEEAEAFTVNNVARADLYTVAVLCAYPGQGAALPLREALGGVNAENVCARLNQCRNTLCVVAGVDACADYITLVLIEQLKRVCLVAVVVLAEYHINKVLLVVYQRQRVQLVVPDDVVCDLEAGICRSGDQLVKRSHELLNLNAALHAGNAVVAAGDNAEQLAVSGAVIGNSHGGVTGALLQLENFLKGGVRLYVGVGYDEACLVVLYAGNHGSLALDRLRTEDKGDTALLRQCDRHTIIRYRLHDCGNHRNVGIQRGFLALFVLNDWCAQAYVRRHALRRGIPRYQQIFVKGMRRFTEIIRHFVVLLFSK